ncbi:MAG: hypothetical protein ABJB32_02875 [Verrucomicrobiota bacterium]
MKIVMVAAVSLLFALSAAMAKQRHCTFRLHTEANANDGSVFATPFHSPFSNRDVFIQKTAWISERDVAGFYPYHARDGSYGVLLQLDDHGKIVLDTLSVERRGSFLFIFVNGRPLTELQVDRRVADGKIYLSSGLTATDIQLMSKDWKLLGKRKK